jgi:hypothetical protein
MVRDPVRGAARLLALDVNCTSPVPLFAELLMVNHGVVVDEVQLQPGAVVAVTDPEPPDAGTVAFADWSAKLQTVPDCVTVTELPPIDNCAVREFAEPLEVAVTLAVPAPVTDPEGETDSHAALLLADHAQPGLLVATAIAPVPPAAANGLPSADVSRLRSHGRPDCVIWKL